MMHGIQVDVDIIHASSAFSDDDLSTFIMAQPSVLPEIRTLSMWQISMSELQGMILAPFFLRTPNLTTIDISSNRLNDDACEVMSGCMQTLVYLRSINLSDNQITGHGAQHFCKIRPSQDITLEIDFSRCPLGDDGCCKMAEVLRNPMENQFAIARESRGISLILQKYLSRVTRFYVV